VERLPVGTKEFLVVDVSDALQNLSTLDGTVPTFDVIEEDGTPKITAAGGTLDPSRPMAVLCLVDTASWTPAEYRLFVTINAAPEVPRIGPFDFVVE
jgi:hypothetical protein